MQQSEFNLLRNPFAILRIGARSTRVEAAAARDEVIWDHDVEEDEAGEAYASLASPKERLTSELGFLLGMSPASARKAIDALRQGNLSLPADGTPPLAAVNLLAHGLNHGGDPREWGMALVNAYEAVELASVAEEISANCQISGERSPSAKEVDTGLSKLSERHGEALAHALASPDAAPFAAAIIEYWPDGDMPSRLGDAFISAYRRHIAKPLAEHEEHIASLEKVLIENPSVSTAQLLAGALADWDHLRQPVQIWDASHGLDEPESERLGEKLRDLSVRLVNQKQAFAEARVILDALIAAFPELPALSRKLQKASEELDEAASDAAVEEAMGPLLIAVESIIANEDSADRHLGWSVANSDWPIAGALRSAFAAAIKHDATVAVRLVRSLAIRLYNEHDRTAAALGLTKWLQQVAPKDTDPEAIQQLAIDEQTLNETRDMSELNSAMQRGDNAGVAEVAKRLASRTKDPEERDKLLFIAIKAEERKRREGNSKLTRRIFAGMAVLGFLFVVFSGNEEQSYEEAPAAEAPAAEYEDPATYQPSPDLSPDVYRGRKYSREYDECETLKSSINSEEFLVDTADENSVSSFNEKVEQFNRECAGRWR